MGRGCTMDEWVHFDRLLDEGRVPNSSYWYVHCRHCVRGYEQKQLVNAPAKLTGRRSAMKAHLKVCPMYATQYKMEQRALAAAAAAVIATTAAHTRVHDTNHSTTATMVVEPVTGTGDDDITINHTVSMDPSLASPSASPSLSPSNPTGITTTSTTTTTTPGGTPVVATGTVTIKTQSGEKRKRRGEDVEASGPRGGRGKHCMMEEWEHFIRLQDEGYIGKSNFFYAVCRHCQAAYDQADDDKKPAIALEKMVGRREKMRKHLSVCPYFKGELPSLERRTPARTGPGGSGGGPHAFLPLPTADGIKMVPASALTSAAGLEAAGFSFGGGATGNANGSGLAEANAGELAVVPTTVASVSARLALDEWQYFTRLQRKKDSAYYFARCNFCQQAFDNAPDALRSSVTPTVVMGRKSNMQTHLAKCPYVPKDAVLFGKTTTPLVLGGGHSASGASGVMYTATASRDEYAAASKRFKMAGQLDTGSASLHLILVEFLIQQRLPFEWVDTASARKLLRLAAVGANVNTNSLPTSDELRGPVLDELVRNEYQRDVERLKQTVALPMSPLVVAVDGATTTATATGDAASSATARLPVVLKLSLSQPPATESELPTIDCLLSANGVAVPLEYVVTDKEHAAAIVENEETEDELDNENEDKDEDHRWMVAGAGATSVHVARQLTSQLRRLYEDQQLSTGVLVASPSPAMNRVAGLLRSKFPGIACVWNLDDVVSFCVRKALENAHIAQVVEATVELWQSPDIQAVLSSGPSELASSSITSDWRAFSAFAQELLSEPLSSAIEGKMSRDELLRVGNLFRALTVVHAASRTSQDSTRVLTLADTFTHVATLYAAADGFGDVQRALEVAWHASEQPLFVLAHALHPHSRLRGVAAHTDLTKLSVLSDLAVAYFTQFFGGRKPLSLRGDVTSFLHMSQPVFADSFVSEFPLVDDYYRYLRDNFPELAALMELLQSFSVVASPQGDATVTPQTTAKDVDEKTGYTLEESKKLAVLQERWKLDTPLQRPDTAQKSVASAAALAEEGGDVLMEDDQERHGASSVVATWLHTLEESLAKRMVDFSEWETTFQTLSGQEEETSASADTVAADTTAVAEPTASTDQTESTELPLPALAADDVDAYADATKLQPPRATKVRLAQLFAGSEATTV